MKRTAYADTRGPDPWMAALLLLLVSGCAATGINQGQVNVISSDEEVRLGQELAAEVKKQYPLYGNASVTAYVQSVGNGIVQQADRRDISYHFAVIEGDEANAFALPGGYVYVYTGLMKTAGDEAEFASVLAHEIGHVAARHATERLTQQYGYEVISGILLGSESSARLIADLVATGGFLKYSRDAEFEADQLGARYLHGSNYAPQAMIDFMQRMISLESSQPSDLATWLSTHPPTSDRLARVRGEIATFTPLSNPARNASAYAAIKGQLP